MYLNKQLHTQARGSRIWDYMYLSFSDVRIVCAINAATWFRAACRYTREFQPYLS